MFKNIHNFDIIYYMSDKYKIAFFGGTFDPFTEAHRNIVEQACKFVDEVIIVPTAVDWYRKDKTTWLDTDQKMQTICATMDNSPCKWRYDDAELKRAEYVDAANLDDDEKEHFLANRGFYDTLIELKSSYGKNILDKEFYFIIGTDQYKNFKNWRNWQRILKHAKMIVVQGRNGEIAADDPDIPHETITIDPKYADVSATTLRDMWMPKGYAAFYGWLCYEYSSYWREERELVKTPIFSVVNGKAVKKLKPADVNYDWQVATKKIFCPVLVKAPDWASIIVEKDGKWLMVKQLRYGTNAMSTEFPCGMVEKDEPSIVAACRELQEETGVKLKLFSDLHVLGAYSPNPAFMTNKMHYFYVNLDECTYDMTDTKFDEHEDITHEWIDKEVVKRKILQDSNSSVIMIAALEILDSKLPIKNIET